jgi:hypothetical protein
MENSLTATDGQTTLLTKLVQWFEDSEDSSADARQESERCRDYYDGRQLTDAEKAVLKKRKQPIIVTNRIKPKVNTLKGLEGKSRTNPKALPRNQGHDEGAAEAAQDSIRFVLDENDSDALFSECFDELAIEGTEGIEVNVEPLPKTNDFMITLRQIHWDRQFGDPHSREKSYIDAKYLGEVMWMDYEDAVEQYPEAEKAIQSTIDKFGASTGDTYNDKPQYRWADAKRKRVCLISICYREGGRWMHCIFVRGGFVQPPQEVPFVDEDGNSECIYIFQSAYVDRDGNRYGPVKDWLSPQDEINKRRSKALHLLNVRQAKVRKGAVDSLVKLREELAKPDGLIEENIEGGVTLLQNSDLAQGQFQLLAEAKQEIDGMGVNAALAGTEARAMSGRALEARANTGVNEVQPILDAHQQFKNRVYRAIWNRIRQYWTEEKWVRVTDNEKNVKFVGLNQPVTMGDRVLEQVKASGRQITPEIEQQVRSDPQMQVVIGQKNVPAQMDVDIILDEVPDFAALQSEQFAQLSEMAGKGMPIPPEAIIQASSLRDKDKILKLMRGETEEGQNPQVMKMQQEMQQLMQAVEGLTQENEQLKQDRDIKAREVSIKAAEAEIKGFEAETDRMRLDRETVGKAMEAQEQPPAAPEPTPDQGASQMEALVQMFAQALQQQAAQQEQSQAQFAEQIIGAIEQSSAATLSGLEQLAQTLMAERMQPRTIRAPSGRTIRYDPSTGEMQHITQ